MPIDHRCGVASHHRHGLLTLLKQCTNTHHLKQTRSLLIASGRSQDAVCRANVLKLDALSLRGDAFDASLALRHFLPPTPSLRSDSSRAHCARHVEAVAHYAQMLRRGVVPDMHTYPVLLKTLSKSGGVSPNQVHAHVFKFGFCSDSFVRNTLVAAYAKCGDLTSARRCFERSSAVDLVSWTAMIQGYVENYRPGDALVIFAKMRSLGVQLDAVAVVSVLRGCGMLENVWLGRCIHGFFVICGRVVRDVFVGSALVDLYAKCGCCDDARKAFEEMSCTNVVTWSAMIAGYAHCHRHDDAIRCFLDMLAQGLRPNQVTLASVLMACAQMGALAPGRWIHHYVKINGLELNSIVETSLIDMYAKCGRICDATKVFGHMPHKDVYPWSALINGLAMHGRTFECLDSYYSMLKAGVQPNEVTFIGVLAACSHGGLVDQGRQFFECMLKDHGIRPRMEHYGCMVDLLGRAGRMEEALQLVQSMPMEPSAGVWGAMLSACMRHGEFEIGERVGRHLVRIQPSDDGIYARLANLYSFSLKWREAAGIRMEMKAGRRMEKTRGCSWTEVNGVVREFVALDVSHPESNDIYESLHSLNIIMKQKERCFLHCHNSLEAVK